MRDLKSDTHFVNVAKGWKETDYNCIFSVGAIKLLLNQSKNKELRGIDIGGGIGIFAKYLSNFTDSKIDVIDPSKKAKENFVKYKNTSLISKYFNEFKVEKKYDFATINLVLHHIIDTEGNDKINRKLQKEFLKKAKLSLKQSGIIIIQENFYNGIFNTDISGKIIYKLTHSKFLKKILSPFANTAGEGVRFRSLKSWENIINETGLSIISTTIMPSWGNNWRLRFSKIPLLINSTTQGVIVCKINH